MSGLRFLLDENVPRSVMKFLESGNNCVESVPKGARNSKVIQLARKKKAILITRDSDFTNILLYPPEESYGIVVLQIHPPRSELLVKTLSAFLTEVGEFEGRSFLIENSGYKVIE
jgi:predicted nuclease of predicted toxin-antitoxin system